MCVDANTGAVDTKNVERLGVWNGKRGTVIRERPKTAKAHIPRVENETILGGVGSKRQARCMRHETDDDDDHR